MQHEELGPNWTEIGSKLGRGRNNVKAKWKYIATQIGTGTFDEMEDTALISTVRHVMEGGNRKRKRSQTEEIEEPSQSHVSLLLLLEQKPPWTIIKQKAGIGRSVSSIYNHFIILVLKESLKQIKL